MSLANHDPNFLYANNSKVSPNEIDMLEQYAVLNASVSATWVGTSAGGTAGQQKALVLINRYPDYPRNLLYGVVGTADHGGTWTVTGKNQFGQTITETVGSGTAAAGTPAFATAGTAIFSEVTAGTFTHAGVGNGSARIGVAIGTSATAKAWFGLPSRIAAIGDVKRISWSKENVQTTLNGGTYSSGVHVNTTTHAFGGTAVMGGTESFVVLLRSSHDNAGSVNVHTL